MITRLAFLATLPGLGFLGRWLEPAPLALTPPPGTVIQDGREWFESRLPNPRCGMCGGQGAPLVGVLVSDPGGATLPWGPCADCPPWWLRYRRWTRDEWVELPESARRQGVVE